MHKMIVSAMLCVGAMAAQAAAGVWDTKPYLEWTDKDIASVLGDSPWAGKASLTNARIGGGFNPVPDWKVIVTWQSALPVRQAILRQLLGPSGRPTTEQQKALDAPEATYIIRIAGLPGMYASTALATQIGNSAQLERDGKAPLKASQGGAQRLDKEGRIVETAAGPASGSPTTGRAAAASAPNDGSTTLLVLGFPKSDPITAADKEVVFSATVGAYEIKRKFKLKEMTINGEPAL
jgi:hypothetical protein